VGENVYPVGRAEIRFEEGSSWACLCTFPHNSRAFGELDPETVKSLALFGAACRLALEGDLRGLVLLPSDVPQWIRDGIDKAVKKGNTA
jgi:hypothetical protein